MDLTATNTIGKWTFGPVGYYVAQVTDDKCPVGICTAFNPLGTLGASHAQRFQVFALGGLLEYNFGPASFSVWVTQELYAKARTLRQRLGAEELFYERGMTVLATLSYRLWAPRRRHRRPCSTSNQVLA